MSADRFPKRALKAQAFRVSGNMLPLEPFLDFNFLKSLFWGSLSHSDRILASLGVTLASKGKRAFVPRDEVPLCLSPTVQNFYT